MTHFLPELPFDKDALKPFLTAETLEFHHGKHHRTYVDQLNKLIVGTEVETSSLEDIIKRASGKIFNNGAQAWNHTFYWNCLTPKARDPQGGLLASLERAFGGDDAFWLKFSEAAVSLFGSGWVWLALGKGGQPEIVPASNAENPLRQGLTPLLTIDVWEHAYYIDYRNARRDYVERFRGHINWDFVERQYEQAKSVFKAA